MTLEELLDVLVAGETLTGATLSRPRAADPDAPRRITVEPVTLRRGNRWRVRRHYGSRTTDENLDAAGLDRSLERRTLELKGKERPTEVVVLRA